MNVTKSRLTESIGGFTLTEIMITVIIVSVLAAVAVPQYSGMVEKTIAGEAINNIRAIRNAEETYKASYGRYNSSDAIMIQRLGLPAANDATNGYWRYAIGVDSGKPEYLYIVAYRSSKKAPAGVSGQYIGYQCRTDATSGQYVEEWTGTYTAVKPANS